MKKNRVNKYLYFSIVIAIFNTIYCFNENAALFFVILQIGILVCLFMRKKYTDYLCSYLIMVTFSLEYDYYLGTKEFYSFKNFRLFGINLCIWMLLPILIFVVLNIKNYILIIKKDKLIKRLLFVILSLNVIGMLIGLYNILINDNNITSIEGIIVIFFKTVYENCAFLLTPMVTFIYILLRSKDAYAKIGACLEGILVGGTISLIFAAIWIHKGKYGGSQVLAVSLSAYFYSPFLLLVAEFQKKNKRIIYTALGIIAFILAIKNVIMSKLIIVNITILCVYYI